MIKNYIGTIQVDPAVLKKYLIQGCSIEGLMRYAAHNKFVDNKKSRLWNVTKK